MYQRQAGVFFSEDMNIGKWSAVEQELHIDILERSKICNTHILQIQKGSSSPCANGQSNSIGLFSTNGDTRNLLMIQEAKEIWEFCEADQIKLTAEYLPGILNTKAGKASREMENSSSEWILNKAMFQKLIQVLGLGNVGMLTSRLCHQIHPRYIGWQPDPHTCVFHHLL